MIKYQRIDGVKISGANGIPPLEITEEGRAIGAIPGWSIFAHPDYFESTKQRNRAIPATQMPSDVVLSSETFTNGASAVNIPSGGGISPNRAINNEAWTIFGALKIPSDPASNITDIARSTPGNAAPGGETGQYSPFIAIPAQGDSLSVYSGEIALPARLEYKSSEPLAGREMVFMVTFSTREGLRIRIDGKEEAAAPDDKTPFYGGYLAGEWEFWRSGSQGMVAGMYGLLDIDLSWYEHSGYRRALESYLMSKYGIT